VRGRFPCRRRPVSSASAPGVGPLTPAPDDPIAAARGALAGELSMSSGQLRAAARSRRSTSSRVPPQSARPVVARGPRLVCGHGRRLDEYLCRREQSVHQCRARRRPARVFSGPCRSTRHLGFGHGQSVARAAVSQHDRSARSRRALLLRHAWPATRGAAARRLRPVLSISADGAEEHDYFVLGRAEVRKVTPRPAGALPIQQSFIVATHHLCIPLGGVSGGPGLSR
jgi:hypothetical protein